MRQYISLGPTPSEEECVQVGSDKYLKFSLRECNAYIGQLYRILAANGKPREKLPEAFAIVRKAEPHDFGTYYEVNARYDTDDEESLELALWLDKNIPTQWDEQARKEINNVFEPIQY